MESEWKVVRYCLWGFSAVFFAVGVFAIVDGIISVCNNGYADNILLGLMVAICFPGMLLGISILTFRDAK